ncbi:MAG: ABC transporter permease [Acidobacteria bacterium]|nr:ABC transporter permease [Acidobacteriota bacterium]
MFHWFRAWRERGENEAELAEELRTHLAIEVRRRIDAGQDPLEAEREARRLFGSIAAVHEDTRETWGWSGLERTLEDVRIGLRLLRKTPLWTAVVSATLILGIGMSTGIFSAVHGVLLRPLPYHAPGSLVALWPSAPTAGYERFAVSAALWQHWKQRTRSFDDIALTRPIANFNLTGGGIPERLQGARCTANLPAVLGVEPLLGRIFTEEERRADAKVALLSHRLWKRRFASDPAIIGAKIQLNGEAYQVLAVMPEHFRYPSREFEIWTPLFYPPQEVADGGNYQYRAVARLKPATSLRQARLDVNTVMDQLAVELPGAYRTNRGNLRALVEPLAESDANQVSGMLYALLGAAGCLLLIGALNLGVLLIARVSARAHEMAMRQALGAAASRLRRQVLAELLPLAAIGAIGGVALAFWILRVLVLALPPNTPRLDEIGLHPPVLAFAVAASTLVVLLAALLPSRVGAGATLAAALRANSRTVTSGLRARDVLVISQIAVTLALLFNGALFARSLLRLWQVNPGFSTERVLTMHLAVTRAQFRSDRQVSDYYDRLLARIRSIPGVVDAGMVNRLPLSGIAQTGGVEFEGITDRYDTDWRSATPGYMEAMGIPLERGRFFFAQDRPDSPLVGIIDGELARRAFGSQDPIGRRFRIYAGPKLTFPWTTIVGVAGHIRNDGPEKDVRPQAYWPESQRTQDRAALVVKTSGRPEAFTGAVLQQIRAENPQQPVYEVRSMQDWLTQTVQSRNLLTGVVAVFAAASLLLAGLGLYGVISYTTGLRLREFGIRIALGARARDVRSLVLRQAARLLLWGSLAGFALSFFAGRAIESLLFNVSVSDGFSWLVGPVLLALCGFAAAIAPARRAASADPAETLRADCV